MLAFILNVMATIVYAVAASLLLAKIRVKAALHFSPSIPFRCLIYSLLALGALYLLRVIFFYRGQGIPGIYLKEDHYLRITFTCLPIYCITFTSIASKNLRNLLLKRSLMFLPGIYALFILLAVLIQKEFTTGVLFSGFASALCLTCILSGFMQFFVLNKELKYQFELGQKEIRSFWLLIVTLPVISLAAYLLVGLGFIWPARIFFALFVPAHIFFITAIIMKDTNLVYGGRWVEETQIQDSVACQTLQEKHNNITRVYMDIYQKIKDYLTREKAYKSPAFTRNDMAVGVGTNITYVSRALNECAGVSFKQLINSYLVKHAQEYFRQHPQARLIELCNESGFRSLTALNIAFRENVCMTPGEWCRKELSKINNEKDYEKQE